MTIPAELREEAAFARARAEAAHFADIKKEWLRIAAEYERLANSSTAFRLTERPGAAVCYPPAKSSHMITANRTVTPNPSAIFHMRSLYGRASAGRESS